MRTLLELRPNGRNGATVTTTIYKSTDILTVNIIEKANLYGINLDGVKETKNNMYKTIHFSRYCWSGYLPKRRNERIHKKNKSKLQLLF